MLARAGHADLLDVDPELASGLSPDQEQAARSRLQIQLLDLQAEEMRGKWGSGAPGLVGLLVVEGAVLREVRTAQRVIAELIGPGDLIRPFDEDGEEELPVRTEIRWRVVHPLLLGTVDSDLVRAASEWPPVFAALTARAVRRAQRMSVNFAISHLVRVADRLLLLFWHLSEHWGRVTPDGVVIDLPLTHAQLALMVGAERPSVTTALGQLAADGIVTRTSNRGWVLEGPVPDDVGTLLTRTGALKG